MDHIWSSCNIIDHPKGRQKKMLDLNLVQSFNDLNYHPSDFRILNNANINEKEYKKLILSSC